MAIVEDTYNLFAGQPRDKNTLEHEHDQSIRSHKLRIDLKEHPHIGRLMSPEDQKRYGFVDPGIHPDYEVDHHAPVKTGKLEREEQGHFWNWLCLNGYAAGTIWHRTDKRSTGTLGTPDFVVPTWVGTLYIEFKMPGATLSEAQKDFRAGLEAKGHTLFIVYSSDEAIALVSAKDKLV